MDKSGKPAHQHFPRDVAVAMLREILPEVASPEAVVSAPESRRGGTSFDEALARVRREPLAPEDRGWLQEIVQGVLRWKGRLDLVIDSYAKVKPPEGPFRLWLYTGVYQILAQHEVAAAPVASETVEYIKKHEGEAQSRFANAVLRKLAAERSLWLEDKPPRGNDDVVSNWYSLPLWMWKALVGDHKFKWADAYARASLERPPVWVRARGPAIERADSGPFEGSYQLTGHRDVRALPGYAEGAFFVQDISSQFLIREISAIVNPSGARLKALDPCAAPGGKSIGLAWQGFEVTALDYNQKRLPRLQENVARLAPNDVRIGDFAEFDSGGADQDLVWLDPPCTGTGVLRRHPEIRWHRSERDLESLTELQRDLLARAWKRVKPGGYLVYSICSVLKAEGESLADWSSMGSVAGQWLLSPAEAPHGDGFWAILVRKPA